MKENKFVKWIKSPASDFALFIILLFLANFVSHNAFLRFDLTAPKSYSLSKPSKQMVKTLDEPLSIKVFFDDNLPSPYNSYAQYVKDLLVEYEGAANNNFSVSYMDMKKPENIELASDYGIRQVQIQEVKNNEIGFKQVHMGMAISYGDSIEKIDPITSIDGLEYKITSKISDMISTVDMLSGLGKGNKIALTLYMSSALKTLRISGIDQVEELVRDTYKTVNKQNLDRIDFSVVNPAAMDVNGIAERYGLQTVNYQNSNRQMETAVFGLVLSLDDNFRVLPLIIERGFFGYSVDGLDEIEENINSGIQSLLSKATSIGFVVGHREHSLNDERDSANFDKMITDSGNYILEELDLFAGPVPAGMTTIIVDGPQEDYTEEELYRIDQFVMRGGNVLFFIDGTYGQGGSQYQPPSYFPLSLNIDTLLNAYGVKRDMNMVLDKNCHVQASQSYGKLEYYWVPSLQNKELAKHHPITSNLGYVYMLQNSSLDVSDARDNKDVKVTVLAKSSPEAWTMENNIMLTPLMLSPPADESKLQSYDLAVLLEGKFTSAFDEAPVHILYDDDGNEVEIDTTEDEFQAASHISSSRLPGKIFVIGSSQVTTFQLLNGGVTEPISMFLMNVIDYMSGNEDLCTMRTKGLSLNTLTINSQAMAQFFKYFNEFGLVILVAISGLIVWRVRTKRRMAIRKRYNPNDDRLIVKRKITVPKNNEKAAKTSGETKNAAIGNDANSENAVSSSGGVSAADSGTKSEGGNE